MRPHRTLCWAMGYASQARMMESYATRHLEAAETPPRERDQQAHRVAAFECYDAARISWINAIRNLIS